MTAEAPYLFNLKAVARRLPGGAGNISGSQMALPPAPVLRADSQSSIPSLSQGEPSLLHSALLLPSILHSLSGGVLLPFTGKKPSPLQGTLGEGRGLLPGEWVSSGALAPSPPLAVPIPGQQLPGRRNTEHRTGQAYAERIVNTIHLKVIFSLACMTPAFSSPSIFDSFYPSPF